ncbi:hypothetical protein [Lysobacter soli]|uniref:hypothetical protein n=1 Tax=Lysobacter soli TaxID=453783 RepID=UPI003CF25D36
MDRKIALKRLTHSDLSLFRWYFEQFPSSKQKAFNLDAKVLVSELYPRLAEPTDVPKPRFPIDLYLLGPGLAPAHNLARKILKQEKNWRLNGELIGGPDEAPNRYDSLRPEDYAIMEFSGDLVPDTLRVQLIAAAVPEDAGLYRELSARYRDGSMWRLTEADIAAVIDATVPSADHAIRDWTEGGAIEDAVQGGASGLRRLANRRHRQGISPEDFQRARRGYEQTGIAGEEALNSYLQGQVEAGLLDTYQWTSSINAVAPFDFTLHTLDGQIRRIDAKSTTGDFNNAIHMSLGELAQAVEGEDEYDIYRLFGITASGSAKLRIASNVGPALRQTLEAVRVMPAGVTVDSVSILPSTLNFSQEEMQIGDALTQEVVR